MIALDYTVVIQIVAFLFLWFLLTKLLFNPFLGLLEERERRTEGVKTETASLIDEGERLRAEYENGITQARDEGNAVKETIVHEGRQAREQLLAQTREEAARLVQTVREEVQSEMQREQELVAREAEVIAQQMVEKILGRRVG
ncbi:MAG: ATP synthase F0 subunit B [Deltaproteobacteria bacterium]|nr:ATP synthase F0 subunit B [Deltaproteobacteria bacterium]MCZ6623509.1 ATP synthase F0 subunit B [Deltaproteobacteria bacterium]